jgi:hypothetical protein
MLDQLPYLLDQIYHKLLLKLYIIHLLTYHKCFRSFKNFDQEKYTEDLNKIHFDKLTDQDDVNKMYSDFDEAFIQTIDKHAPVKQRKPCQNPAPFIKWPVEIFQCQESIRDIIIISLNVSCFLHDIAEKLLIWRYTDIISKNTIL